jgi:hypothetical protein
MSPTKRDVSGVFDAQIKTERTRKAAVLDPSFHLSHKGLTFVTETFLPEWTEVGVEMRLPNKVGRKDQQIICRGVIVQCTRQQKGTGFQVTLVFLDLPKRAQTQLGFIPHAITPSSISISR